MKKKTLTLEHRKALSEAAKISNSTRVLSEETLKKMSDSAKKREAAKEDKTLPEGMIKRKEHIWLKDIECKECSKCKGVKPLTEFGKDKSAKWDGLNYYCKVCHNQNRKKAYKTTKKYENKYAVNRRRQLKIEAVEYKGGICQKCGLKHETNHNTAAFQFHHRDPSKKDFTIAARTTTVLDNLKPELDKCDLLCATCHHIVHWSLKKDLD